MRRILFLFPTAWDALQLRAARASWLGHYEPILAEPSDNDSYGWRFDVTAYVESLIEREGGRLAGVASSSDYPGTAAAAILAARLGLAGTRPEQVLLAQHKHAARVALAQHLPEATPRFALLDALGRSPLPAELFFPCFVKPVKGSFSVCTHRIDSRPELEAFLGLDSTQDYARYHGFMFDRLLTEHGLRVPDTAHFLAEELLSGALVTVEGFASRGQVTVFGVVDSIVHPRTRSFVRFDYPSRLAPRVQERMEEIAARAAGALGLDQGLFNVELFHDPASGRIDVVEVNPRVAGQFADLYEKVDGTSSYALLLALAAGERPTWQRRAGRYACAASVPLRIFEPARVVRSPDAAMVEAAEALYDGTLVYAEVKAGTLLADFARGEDGTSVRYAVVNLGAHDHAELMVRSAAIERALGFRFEAV